MRKTGAPRAMPSRSSSIAVGARLAERQELGHRQLAAAVLADDVKEIEERAVFGVRRDERAAPLLPQQDALGDELVDRLADRCRSKR